MSFDSVVLADSPVAYLKLAETSGTTAVDSSGNGHNGTYINVTLGQTGLISGESEKSASFDGSTSYVDIGNPSALQITGQIAIEAIIKAVLPSSGAGLIMQIAAKSYDGANELTFRLACDPSTTNQIHAGVYQGSDNTEHINKTVIGWASNETHIVFAQYTGSSWDIYVDGGLLSSSPDAVGALPESLGWSIGAELRGSPIQFFNGNIEKVSIYNTALSSARILAHAIAAGFSTGLQHMTGASVPVTGEKVNFTVSGSVTGLSVSDFHVVADGLPIRLLSLTGSGASYSAVLDSRFITLGQTIKLSYTGTAIDVGTLSVTNSSTVPLVLGRFAKKQFGAFITFTAAQFPAAVDPVIQSAANIWFNPAGYSMDNILDGCQGMGADYTVLTAKHAASFCLWPTLSGAPNIGPTPWFTTNKIDIVKDYVTKSRARGLGVGLYLNFYDSWYTSTRTGHDGTYGPPSTFTAYISQQITELLSNYGKIDYLWLDSWGYTVGYTDAPYATIRALVTSLQPNCILLNNAHDAVSDKLTHSDVAVYENNEGVSPDSTTIVPSEYCDPSRTDEAWVWVAAGEAYKDPFAVAAKLKVLNGFHSNYLLNVTPNDQGVLPTGQIAFCTALGAILGTQGGAVLPIPGNVKIGIDRGDGVLGTHGQGINGSNILGMF